LSPTIANTHQRALTHLVVGKTLSAALGVAVLALLWRRVEPLAYGQYLTLLALLEVLAMVGALGLSTVTQRHWPVWVAHAPSPAHIWRPLACILGLRTVFAAAMALLFFWALSGVAGPALDTLGPVGFLIWVTAGVWARSLEEAQAALMMQGWVQGLSVAAHMVRLAALIGWPPQALGLQDLAWLLVLDLSVSALAVMLGGWALMRHAIRIKAAQDTAVLESPVSWWSAWRTGLGFWVIQCLGLGWSLSSLRLMMNALGGPVAVAVHAAAQSLIDLARQATPLVWMSGWLRATMLGLQMRRPDGLEALHLARGVEAFSAALVWPLLAAWCVQPSAWLRWLAGPGLFEQAQMLGDGFALGVPFTALLAAGSVLVPLQNHHLVLSLWTHTQQTWRWGVCAAAFALLSVAALPLLWPSLGVWSAVAVMAMAEFAWVGVVRWGVGRLADPPKGRNPLMSRALGVPLAAMVSAVLADGLMQGAAAWGAGFIDSSPTPTRLVLCWAAAAFGVWFALRLRPVWSSAEQSVLLACLPGSFLVIVGRVGRGLRA